MRFLYDEPKRLANLAKHGFDFADFEAAFGFGRFLNLPAKAKRTGRERVLLLGTWFGETVVVVIASLLGTEATAIVSVRRAGRKEKATYGRF